MPEDSSAPATASWPRPVRALIGMAGFGPPPAAVREVVAGRLVVVTGASRGIGACTAQRLAAVGARVVLLARGRAELAAMAARIGPGRATVLPVDLRDPMAAREAGERILDEHGRPAAVVSNAGHSIHRALADYTARFHDVARLTGVNMLGPIALALPLLAEMTRAGEGHLVSVSSVSVDLPAPGWSVYGASKGGYEAWLRAVAPELADEGVATTSIHLPLVRTAMSAATEGYARAPALSADEAAGLICRALVDRPRLISPWWARLGGPLTALAPATADRAMTAVWRRRRR